MTTLPKAYLPIVKIAGGLNVLPMREALARHAELWNQRTERTESASSPHHGIDDIWCRFADTKTMQADGSHSSIWYPPSNVLPVREMVFPLMTMMHGEQLGGILITRIPAGKSVKPHVDPGWHAQHYDKFAIQIDADPETQAFCFEQGHELRSAPGDLFWFDNHYSHWVTNEGSHDRITMIVCIRTERTGGN